MQSAGCGWRREATFDIDITRPIDKPNYQEYGEHAQILFIAFLTLAVFGSFGELCLAVLGCGATL